MSKTNRQKRRRSTGIHGQLKLPREHKIVDAKIKQLRSLVQQIQTYNNLQTQTNLSETELKFCKQEAEDIFHQLRRNAWSKYGFYSKEFRNVFWPFLLGCNTNISTKLHPQHPDHVTQLTKPHIDDYQIEKDIERSLCNYDTVKYYRPQERQYKRKMLSSIINASLTKQSDLHYYQGYHDVCSVFLLELGEQRAYMVMQQLNESYFRESMRNNFDVVMQTIRLLFPLLETEDLELMDHLGNASMEPFFALPWIITWFAHDLYRYEDITRLYDVMLVSHPLFSIYVSAALVLVNRKIILHTECDFGTLHGLLAKLVVLMDLEAVIARAVKLFHEIPPTELLSAEQANSTLHIRSSDKLNGPWPLNVRESTFGQYPFNFQRDFNVHKFSTTVTYNVRKLRSTHTDEMQIDTGTVNAVWKSPSTVNAILILLTAYLISQFWFVTSSVINH